jgi:hypothetical protein
VAYHDACHLAHAQRVREAPMRLLRAAGHEVVRRRAGSCAAGPRGPTTSRGRRSPASWAAARRRACWPRERISWPRGTSAASRRSGCTCVHWDGSCR